MGIKQVENQLGGQAQKVMVNGSCWMMVITGEVGSVLGRLLAKIFLSGL